MVNVTSTFISPYPDLKKTMAVLLEDIMSRLERLERRVDAALGNRSANNAQEALRFGAAPTGTAPPVGWGEALVEKMNEIEQRVADPAAAPMRMQGKVEPLYRVRSFTSALCVGSTSEVTMISACCHGPSLS